MEKNINKWQWALLAGGLTAAAFLWGCLNTMSVSAPDWTSGGTDPGSPDPGSGNLGGQSPAAPGTGIVEEEFTLTLQVEGDGPEGAGSRSIVGSDTGGVQYGGIRNIVQVIQVNADTGKVAHFQQVKRKNDAEASVALAVVNPHPGQRYHFLVLTGHQERDYAHEQAEGDYRYFDGTGEGDKRPPTLLAAGFLADQEIRGGETIVIPMKTLLVDTVFKHGGDPVHAALPANGGNQLPAGVAAGVVWTLNGSFVDILLDAQYAVNRSGGGFGIDLDWGSPFVSQATILNWTVTGGGSPKIALEDRQIILDLGAQEKDVTGSANFNLGYFPFGAGDMSHFTEDPEAAGWIIRNGVNDQAQDGKTVFPNTPSAVSPWDDDNTNGNGAAAFSFVEQTITAINLTDLVPAPVTFGTPQANFFEGTYGGTAAWKRTGENVPYGGAFEANTAYTATVTLYPRPGYALGDILVTHDGAVISPLSKDKTTAVVEIVFPKTAVIFSGRAAVVMESAIDLIRVAKTEGVSSLSLTLVPWDEEVDLAKLGTDIGAGLALTGAESPPEVILDGGGKTIALAAGTGSVITVGTGVTLTLKNITFKGSATNNTALIGVNGGTLVLEDGAVITGNNGGGVHVSGGTFTMKDGTISDNTGGPGVNLTGGAFEMSGGTISNNSDTTYGGVRVYGSGSTFTMSGGTISKNTSGLYGGGVCVESSGTFTMMKGGTISENKAKGYGGGVYVESGTFTMTGGTISGNRTIDSYGGGGVYSKGTFTKTGGTIYGSDVEAPLANTAGSNVGHAVYINNNGVKRLNFTADEGTHLDSTKTKADGGGWDL